MFMPAHIHIHSQSPYMSVYLICISMYVYICVLIIAYILYNLRTINFLVGVICCPPSLRFLTLSARIRKTLHKLADTITQTHTYTEKFLLYFLLFLSHTFCTDSHTSTYIHMQSKTFIFEVC